MFELFLGIAILVIASSWAKKGFPMRADGGGRARRVPVAYRMDPEQRKMALEAYKHAVSEKMDVMKTAIAMGWGDAELKALDERLEQLIGKEELKKLLDGEIPTAMGAQDLDPAMEAAKLHKAATAGG